MLRPMVASDVMFAHYAVRRNIIYAVNIIAEGNITCPQGQTSFGDLRYRRSPFEGFFFPSYENVIRTLRPP